MQINRIEKLVFSMVFLLVAVGMLLAVVDHDLFKNHYVVEDGIIEWLTVLALVVGMVLCILRVVRLRRVKSTKFVVMMLFLALLFLFGAGEEISWGQRLFAFESSSFFQNNNAQGESNLHNLKIGNTKINKLVFGKLLALVMLVYWFVMTPLYHRNSGFRSKVDQLAIPIPCYHQIIAYVVLVLLVQLTASDKRGELLEFGGSFLFLINVAFPFNRTIFLHSADDAGGAS